MTPNRLMSILKTIGWTRGTLARALKVSDSAVWHWTAGKTTIPPLVAIWLLRLEDAHKRWPPPMEWKRSHGGKKRRPAEARPAEAENEMHA